MATDALEDALVRARSLLIDLERHIDRAAAERDLGEVGRAWVRAAQVERLLRGVLPEDVAANMPDVGDPAPTAGTQCQHSHADAPPGR